MKTMMALGKLIMIDFAKFIKYSHPGPRYTSYPTAPEFNESFTSETYTQILQNQDKNKKLSLYVHLPFCRSACYFCGCNVVFTSKNEQKERYIEYLEKEINLLSKHIDTNREVLQFHFGGGTPTFFDANQLEKIIKLIRSKFPNFSPEAEVSVEIDPRFFNISQMDVFKKYGFNRISFGVQDFDDFVQKTIHRIQPFEVTQNAINLARENGINSVNIDLIYGLPHQSLESFKNTLKKAKELDPDRFAIFNYAHLPWMKKTMRKFDETTIPKPEVKLEILKYSIDFLTQNGYEMIGMDHFAKPKDELFTAIDKNELHRNFQGYTTKGGADLIGIGITSIGEGSSHYVQNHKDIKTYEACLDNDKLPVFRGIELNEDDRLRKAVIMSLMSNFKLDMSKIEQEFSINFNEYFKNSLILLEEFIKEDLVLIDKNFIKVSQTGTLLIRNIAMVFDGYLEKNPLTKNKFSKTI